MCNTKHFEAENISFIKFFERNQCSVPPFQRPYCWTKKEVIELISDLKESKKKDKPWYCGPFYVCKRSDSDNLFLLDGQQRFTTLFLILRNLFTICLTKENKNSNSSPHLGNEINRLKSRIIQLLITSDRDGKSKLQLDSSSIEKFNKYITDIQNMDRENLDDSQNSIPAEQDERFLPTLKNINKIIGYIKDELVKENLQSLVDFGNYIMDKILFIKIMLNEEVNSYYDIFESINNRGKMLSLTDLIRFTTLKDLIGNDLSQSENRWKEIYELIEKIQNKTSHTLFKNSDQFLERYINSLSKEDITKNSERVKAFKAKYGDSVKTGIIEILDVLKKWNWFLSIEDGFFSACQAIHRMDCLSTIHLLIKTLDFSNSSQIAFIGYLRNNFVRDSHLTTINDLLKLIKFSFREAIIYKTPANRLRLKFISMANDFKNYDPPDDNHSNFDKISNLIFSKNKATSEFVLLIYHALNSGTFPSKLTFENTYLDHIMPKQWDNHSGWKSQNGDITSSISKYTDDSTDEDLKRYFNENFISNQNLNRSFIELIGNKMIIYSNTNIRKGNKFWNNHPDNRGGQSALDFLREQFRTHVNDSFLIPENPQSILEYESFKIKDILSRSESITLKILEDLKGFQIP